MQIVKSLHTTNTDRDVLKLIANTFNTSGLMVNTTFSTPRLTFKVTDITGRIVTIKRTTSNNKDNCIIKIKVESRD